MTNLTDAFAALSDPTRLGLVELLLSQGELPAGALVEAAPVSAPAVSRHLKVLREAGLIVQRVQGTHRFYSARPEALRAINGWTMDHASFWAGSLDRLDTLLVIDPEGDTG
jgi:DNA-binding transcriptional ArsR family regulator